MARYKTGDIFAIPIAHGLYASGRIMLDVSKQCIRPKKITADSPLDFFAGTLLIDIFRTVAEQPEFAPAERLISGLFVMDDLLKSQQWPIIDQSAVDPQEVEFPETLANVQGRICFQRGEIVLPFANQAPLLDSLNIYPTLHRAEEVPLLCNNYLQQADLIEPAPEDQTSDLEIADLRFTPHRDEVYALLGEPSTEPYHVMAARFGHDIARFY